MSAATSAPSRCRRRRPLRAYTAVEVMLSIVVLGIGAAGVMSMQQASIQGNADAHMIDVATSIAREWIERLRRDAMTWTMPDDANPTPNWTTPHTFLISQIGAPANVGQWIWPAAPGTGSNSASADPGYSRGFDILGRDLALTAGVQPALTFCTNIRGDWLEPDQLIRAEVRVYWLRQLYAAPTALFCSGNENPSALGTGGGTQVYHFVYATTAISRNSPQ